MSRALKENDVLELSKLFEAEFNQADIHDRVLVFDVIESASWPRRQSTQSVEESDRNEDKDSILDSILDELSAIGASDNEADQIEKKTEEFTSYSAEKTESHDYETDEKEASDGIKTDGTQASTQPSEIEVAMEATKKVSALNENVQITWTTNHENDSKSLQDSEIVGHTDENLNNKEQSENDCETENYESNNPISEDEIIRQHKFYVHSMWLALQSSYFRSMFFSGMKESNAKEVHVQISKCEEKSHLMLLEAMYKIDTLDNASVDELLEVLRLAQKYDVKFVFRKCKYCLQAAVVSFEICEQIMRFIKVDNEITDVEDLASTLQSFLAKEFSPLDETWQTTNFHELCEPSLRYLLSCKELVAASENTIFHALIDWIKKRGLDNVSNGEGLPSLLSVVRFELMPVDYLYNIAQHNPVAKKMVDFNQHYLRGINYHAMSEEMREKLPCQPCQRYKIIKLNDHDFRVDQFYVPYTWVIPIKKLKKLAETEEELISDEFWFSGYKMMLAITHVRRQEYNTEKYFITLCLKMMNLKQQSVVEVSWYTKSQFVRQSSKTTHTFKNDAQVSSCNTYWNFETILNSIRAENATPASVSASGSTKIKQASRKVAKTKTQAITPQFSFASPMQQPTTPPPPSFSSSFTTSTNMPELSKENSPQPSPTEPCLPIDVHMNLI